MAYKDRLVPRTNNIASDSNSELYKYHIMIGERIDKNEIFTIDSCWNCCVGVAKKRCGGCGIARYCHVECRNIARRNHKCACEYLKKYVVSNGRDTKK
jgi:hypothetical protein